MRDLESPPFRLGDVAYTSPSPGGFASDAATPVDPAFSGSDQAYAVPSLGGEFEPGSGTPAPNTSIIAKGADADGGAADIASAPRVGAPPAVTPPTPAILGVSVSGHDLIFTGVADAARTVTLTYRVDGDPVGTNKTKVCNVASGSSAGTAAALVATQLSSTIYLAATSNSNVTRISAKSGHTLDAIVGVVIA